MLKSPFSEKITDTIVIYNLLFQKIKVIDSSLKITPFSLCNKLKSKDNIFFEIRGKIYTSISIEQGINYANEINLFENILKDLNSILVEISSLYDYGSLESRSEEYKIEIIERLNNINKNIVNVEDIAIDYLYKNN